MDQNKLMLQAANNKAAREKEGTKKEEKKPFSMVVGEHTYTLQLMFVDERGYCLPIPEMEGSMQEKLLTAILSRKKK